MTRVIVSAAIQAQLHNLDDVLEVCDESGRTLGFFHPAMQADRSTGEKIASPYSDREIEEFRKQRTGRPLSEILKDLRVS
ncbi:MAG TPA: hypothetical protein VGY55_16105 [Pirellulales bacterium]|jgi:hypothetical protein|nr:hypothetical protein [Pirellulales bacterium]